MKVSQALNISRRICEKGGMREERRILNFELGIFRAIQGAGFFSTLFSLPCGLRRLKDE